MARRPKRYATRTHGRRLGHADRTGPASDGALLEIGVLDIDGDDPVVIHADTLRPKFYKFLG
jgi:hypothetical protein